MVANLTDWLKKLDEIIVGVKDLISSPIQGSEEIYNLAGQRIEKLQKGINIVGKKKILM